VTPGSPSLTRAGGGDASTRDDRRFARTLTVRYVVALAAVALLLAAGQLVVQVSLTRQAGDARVVNVAGRQRMLSQRLCVAMLAIERADLDRLAWTHELARLTDEWEHAQAGLRQGGLPGDNSEAVRALFEKIEPRFRAMVQAAHTALADPGVRGSARAALAEQDAFLEGMNEIVAQYEREAHARVVALRRTELILLGSVLVALLLEGMFVFRPAVRGLLEYLGHRERAEWALLKVTDREQQRLGQDLHDGLGQHLVGVAALVKTLRQRLASSPEKADLDLVGKLLSEALDQVRSMARSLTAIEVEADGIAAALRELAQGTERVFGVETVVRSSVGTLSPGVANHLYRIAREAVTNAAKHAKAKHIEVVLERRGPEVVLSVRDDGVGIGEPTPTTGMGMSLMLYRAKLLGGSLDIRRAAPAGTEVTCTARLPVG
jgi:signal transduction histidine kinase